MTSLSREGIIDEASREFVEELSFGAFEMLSGYPMVIKKALRKPFAIVYIDVGVRLHDLYLTAKDALEEKDSLREILRSTGQHPTSEPRIASDELSEVHLIPFQKSCYGANDWYQIAEDNLPNNRM